MDIAAAFKRCLEQLDVEGIRKLWRHVSPHLHQPATEHETLATLHRARTQCRAIGLRLRAYSHKWLLDHGYGSGLPDELKPVAERIYPRKVEGVGVAVRMPKAFAAAGEEIQREMNVVILDEYNSKPVVNPSKLHLGMLEARDRTKRALFGRWMRP